ncbi:hypothetical protein B0H34DRAFT_493391 [Crassisporium funariophilum]|nr:hypothetical protein B0H34DRAFT_493391 [Crassisporium funariophilum]
MSGFPITEAQLTGLLVESILFGIHLITVGYCQHALLATRTRWKRASEINWPMVCVSLALFANATFDLFLGFYHDLKAFVFYTGPGGAVAEFTNISDWINVSRSLTVVTQTMVGDAMLIYRCWVLYSKSWMVVTLSITLWLGCFTTAVWVICLEATLHSHVLVGASQLRPVGTSFWSLTVALNIVTTGLLLWRIRSVDQSNKRYRMNSVSGGRRISLQNVMRSIVESGLIYSIAALTTLVTSVIGSNIIYVTTDAEIQIVGIVFNLIIIRATRTLVDLDGSTLGYANTLSHSHPLQTFHPASQTSADPKTEVHLLVTQGSMPDYSRIESGSK